MELKPGYHDINANFFKGSYIRGRIESQPITRRYLFKPGKIYLLCSQKIKNHCLFYFKEFNIQSIGKDTASIIEKAKLFCQCTQNIAPKFSPLESI
jgi:hypothetical protein